jgi:hypothetical protein
MSRRRFVPTQDQRNNVEAMIGFGITQDEICELIRNPETGKPIDGKTLRLHFKTEIATGEAKLKSMVGNLIVNTILGRTRKVIEKHDGQDVEVEIPLGLSDERARATLTIFFAKTRMGWKETVVNEHANAGGQPFIIHISSDDSRL